MVEEVRREGEVALEEDVAELVAVDAVESVVGVVVPRGADAAVSAVVSAAAGVVLVVVAAASAGEEAVEDGVAVVSAEEDDDDTPGFSHASVSPPMLHPLLCLPIATCSTSRNVLFWGAPEALGSSLPAYRISGRFARLVDQNNICSSGTLGSPTI